MERFVWFLIWQILSRADVHAVRRDFRAVVVDSDKIHAVQLQPKSHTPSVKPKAGDQEWCLGRMPREWKKHHISCKGHLYNLFGLLFTVHANGMEISRAFMNASHSRSAETPNENSSTASSSVSSSVETPSTESSVSSSAETPSTTSSIASSNETDGNEDDVFILCTRAETRNSVSPDLVDMANEVLFLYPLYTNRDLAFSLVMSHPGALWRLVKWAITGYKVTFVRVATRRAAIAELKRVEPGKLRHLVVGGHGNALHRFMNLGVDYLTSTDQLFSKNVVDYQAKNKAAYEETIELFTEATMRLGNKRNAPEASILLDSCETAHRIQVIDTGKITSLFDDVVGIVEGAAQKGQKIKVVGSTASYNQSQVSMCLERDTNGGHVLCASIAKQWSFLFVSGAKDTTSVVIVEP